MFVLDELEKAAKLLHGKVISRWIKLENFKADL